VCAARACGADECEPPLDVAAVQAELRAEKPEVVAQAEAARAAPAPAAAAAPPAAALLRGDEFSLTFLGTGAAIPSKYRNVTGLLLDLPAAGAAMLMDCGEGSLGQLRRRLGGAGADAVLARLRLVWLSHIHADHHVGLPSLLAARTRLLGPDCEPLLVVGPRPLRRALAAYASLEPMRLRYVEAAATAAPAEGQPAPAPEVAAAVAAATAALGLSRLESVRVVHCAHSYGLVVEGGAGVGAGAAWKVAFSGDTRPCPALVAAARGATLLVHEATFDDSMADEAVAKRHCTTREAVESGAAAGAYRTLLTHFSQRYPKVPVIDANFGGSVGIAFDLMTVGPADLQRLPALVPALKALFDEGDEEEGGEDGEAVPQMLS
jgi:ribonuclease Z